ncbi:MAG: sugar ABC transporter ATP-binding protein [Firmicutes bacterium]|nr:sugar ABC transporter ATP-binding protein [Bacillota bacterium]
MSDFLKLVGIKKSFGGVQALKGIELAVGQNEILCLVGENGSGKSTLIKIISGDLKPDSGELWISGRMYKQLRPIQSLNLGIRVIYQDFALFPNLTVAENIAYSQLVETQDRLVNWREIREIAARAVELVQADLDLNEVVGNLSVANQQMTAICRALTRDTRFLILDEPTSALTKKEIDRLLQVVRDLQAKGIAVMFVSHKLNEVLAIAERVAVLRDGELVATLDREEATNERLVELMSGTRVTYSRYEAKPSNEPPLLEVKDLSKRNCFQDISFSLRRGEILGITGLLGSGRTELALALFGIDPADRGQIVVDHQPIKIRTVKDAIKAGIGYVPEDRLTQGLVLKKSVGENIAAVIIDRLRGWLGLIDNRAWNAAVERWIDELAIRVTSPEVKAQTLSGGNQQRVVLAKWLASLPKILILDNATAGIDVAAKSGIHQIIRRMARQGIGIILISDEIPEVVNNCSRILIMRKGRIAAEVETADVTEAEVQQLVELTEPRGKGEGMVASSL